MGMIRLMICSLWSRPKKVSEPGLRSDLCCEVGFTRIYGVALDRASSTYLWVRLRRPQVARLVSAGDYNLSPRGLSEAQTLVFAESICLDPSLRFSSPGAWALQGFLNVPRVRLRRSQSRCLASPGIISFSRRMRSRNAGLLRESGPEGRPHVARLVSAGDYNLSRRGLNEAQTLAFADSCRKHPSLQPPS